MDKPFIYFDLGKVVFDFSGGLDALAQKLQVSIEDVEGTFRQYDNDICRGELQPSDLLSKYETQFGRPTGISDFATWWASFFTPIQQTHQLIRDAKEHGYRIGILSNIYPTVFPKLLDVSAVPNIDWDSVVLSCELGSVKPEKEIFRVAQERSGSQQLYLLDDLQTNVEMARTLGWRGTIFNPRKPNLAIAEIRRELDLPILTSSPETL